MIDDTSGPNKADAGKKRSKDEEGEEPSASAQENFAPDDDGMDGAGALNAAKVQGVIRASDGDAAVAADYAVADARVADPPATTDSTDSTDSKNSIDTTKSANSTDDAENSPHPLNAAELAETTLAEDRERESQSRRQLLTQADTSEDMPRPAKITVVRSKKSLTDLPAMPATSDIQASASAKHVTSGGSTGAYISDASTTSHPQIVGEQDVTALAEALDPQKLLSQAKSRSALNEPVVLAKHPTVSRQNISPIDIPGERRSDTKFVLPGPDQPMPPPQAPPQFLTDQGHTRPSDSSLDRSQFGTASKHGGAPIALLTNVNRKKKKPATKLHPALDFMRNNVISCVLTMALLLLGSVLIINRDPKAEPVTNLDLSILNSAQNLEEAKQLVNGRKYEAALQLCDNVIQKDTKFAEAYHERGQVYMAMHRFREAADDFTTAESYNHRSIDIHIDRAAALYHLQDYDKAKHEYDEILMTEPNNAAAHFGRGLAEENLGSTAEALQDFRKTLDLQSDYAAAFEEMGTIHFAKGDLKNAYDDYTNAIKIAPTVPRFYFNRANALKQDHQIRRAIADYCKAIQLDPSRPEFFNNRGLLYLENDEAAKALTDFSSAVDLDPNYTIAKHNLTLAQERVRR